MNPEAQATRMLLALAVVACSRNPSPPSSDHDGGAASSSAAAKATRATDARPPTTSWSIAGGNLDADIAGRLKRDDPDPRSRLRLVQLLLARAQYLACVGDYEKAADVAGKALAADPKSADAHRARASVAATFHRFAEASRELDEAERLGAPAASLASSRAAIAMATGRYDAAAKLLAPEPVDPMEIATAAVLAGRMQKHDDAERLFDAARSRIRDVSPFPVAWIAFQRAMWLEERGKETSARVWYEEAIEAIPVYTHAAVHIAASDPPARAIARLAPLRERSDDPDVLAALADAHRRAENDGEAARYAEAARQRYDELVERYPEAYSDHAARFFLREGIEPERAVALASRAASQRSTEEAVDLWMATATAASQRSESCRSALAMGALPYASAERKRLATAMVGSFCPSR